MYHYQTWLFSLGGSLFVVRGCLNHTVRKWVDLSPLIDQRALCLFKLELGLQTGGAYSSHERKDTSETQMLIIITFSFDLEMAAVLSYFFGVWICGWWSPVRRNMPIMTYLIGDAISVFRGGQKCYVWNTCNIRFNMACQEFSLPLRSCILLPNLQCDFGIPLYLEATGVFSDCHLKATSWNILFYWDVIIKKWPHNHFFSPPKLVPPNGVTPIQMWVARGSDAVQLISKTASVQR